MPAATAPPRRLAVMAALATAALLVAGCVGAAPSASPRASGAVPPSPSATERPSPSATPTTTPRPTPTPTPTAAPTSTPQPMVAPTPTPKPTPKPTPRPTTKPTPPPTPATSVLVTHGSRTGNDIALTFDMGGRVGDAREIVAWLIDHDVPASIFMTGAMADDPNTDAGRDVLAAIDAHPSLFTLGNHSYGHPDFRDLSAAEIRGELARTEAAIAPWCDQDPRPFFRPPYGGQDAGVLAAVGAAGYRATVTWDIDTIDWRPIKNDPPGPTADQIVSKVLDRARGGSIVLMHLGGYETFEALPRIVDGLRDAGLDLVTLDDLLP